MKLQNIAIVFVIIIIPISLILSLMLSNGLEAAKRETYYDTALSTATRDGIKALEYNSYASQFLAIADTAVRDAKATVNTFLNSFAMNLGLGDSQLSSLKTYIPAAAYIMYDGFYVYTPDIIVGEGGRDILEHSLKPYIYYSKEYYNIGNIRMVVNYTLDNFINVYIYDSSKLSGTKQTADPDRYKYMSGYIFPIDTPNGIQMSPLKYKGIEITNSDAVEFYTKAYNFTRDMRAYGMTWNYKYKVEVEDPANPGGTILEDRTEVVNNLFQDYTEFDTQRVLTIRDTIQSTLNAAIGNYNAVSGAFGTTYNFKMPVLKPTEWEIALSNLSLIAFCQGINMGSKYYNSYSIASSFSNSYYTTPDELCFVGDDDILHKIDCEHLDISGGGTIRDGGKYLEMDRKMLYYGLTVIIINETNPADISNTEVTVQVENSEATHRVTDMKRLSYKYENCYYCMVDRNYTPVTLTPEKQKAYYETYAKEKLHEARRYNLYY